MNNTNSPHITILPLRETRRAFLAVPGITLKEAALLTSEQIDTLASTLDPVDWEAVAVDAMPAFEIPAEDLAADMPIAELPPTAEPPNIAARARQIGVSVQTLHRWRREGTDIFNDDEIRALVSRRRSHLWQVSPEFKPALPSPEPRPA